MTRSTSLLALSLLAFSFLFFSSLCLKASAQSVVQEPEFERWRIDLDWQGGSVGEFFKILNEMRGGYMNFVVTPGAKDVQVPPFQLKNSSLPTICSLLDTVVTDLELTVAMGSDHGSVSDFADSYEEDWKELQQAMGVPCLIVKLATFDGNEPILRSVNLYRLSDILAKYALAELATAVETAWAFLPGNSTGTLKFHEETKLLICSGTPDQLEIASQLIDDLREQVEDELHEERNKRQRELQDLQQENDALRRTIENLERTQKQLLEQLRKESKKSN